MPSHGCCVGCYPDLTAGSTASPHALRIHTASPLDRLHLHTGEDYGKIKETKNYLRVEEPKRRRRHFVTGPVTVRRKRRPGSVFGRRGCLEGTGAEYRPLVGTSRWVGGQLEPISEPTNGSDPYQGTELITEARDVHRERTLV